MYRIDGVKCNYFTCFSNEIESVGNNKIIKSVYTIGENAALTWLYRIFFENRKPNFVWLKVVRQHTNTEYVCIMLSNIHAMFRIIFLCVCVSLAQINHSQS